MNTGDITPEMVEAVENSVGVGSGAWDCVDPREIIAAVLSEAGALRIG